MALFIITIQCDGDAFHDPSGTYYPGPEIARILADYAKQLATFGGIDRNIYDINGNKVGTALLGRRSGT